MDAQHRLVPYLVLGLLAQLSGCVGVYEVAPPPSSGQQDIELPGAAPRFGTTSNDLPGSKVQFVTYGVQKSASDPGDWGAVLTDIEGHLPSSYGTQYRDADKLTHGHETTHGINSDVRNYHNDTGKKANGFYVLESKAVLIVEPNMRKSAVAAYVPQGLRGMRFGTYVTGQTAWDDMPTYLMDEWVAYRNGSKVGVDLVKSGKWHYAWRDGVAGTLEFTAYGIALAMAVEQRDPQYFATNGQFKEFTAWLIIDSLDVFRQGQTMEAFKYAKQDAYYDKLKNGADGAAMRDFIKRVYGSAFLARMWGETNPPPQEPNPPQDPGTPPQNPNPPQDPGTPPENPNPPQDPGTPPGNPNPPQDPGTPPESPAPPLDQSDDADGDGVPNAQDLCSGTPSGAQVWTGGAWLGCAGGEFRDADDADRDGVPNALDRCTKTPSAQPVWKHGEWSGCAAGEYRD